MSEDIDRAPRFMAFFQHYKNRPVFKMSRVVWDKMNEKGSDIIIVNIENTPIGEIKKDTQYLESIIDGTDGEKVYLKVYRRDENDYPYIINEDRYEVIERISDHVNVERIASEASTSCNENFSIFVESTVFLIKEKPGPNHWMKKIPENIYAQFKQV